MGLHLSRGVDYEIYILDIDDHSGDMFLPGRFLITLVAASCVTNATSNEIVVLSPI